MRAGGDNVSPGEGGEHLLYRRLANLVPPERGLGREDRGAARAVSRALSEPAELRIARVHRLPDTPGGRSTPRASRSQARKSEKT